MSKRFLASVPSNSSAVHLTHERKMTSDELRVYDFIESTINTLCSLRDAISEGWHDSSHPSRKIDVKAMAKQLARL